jgi:hypothetical protein
MTFSEFFESKVDEQTTWYDYDEGCTKYGPTEYENALIGIVWADLEPCIDDELAGEFFALNHIHDFNLGSLDGIDKTIEWLSQYGPVEVNLYESFNNATQMFTDFFISTLTDVGVDEDVAEDMVSDPHDCDIEIGDPEDEWLEAFSEYMD